MDISLNAFLGMGMGLGPLGIFVLLIAIPWSWGKWVAPLMIVLPVTCGLIGWSSHSLAAFNGIMLGVFLYVLGILLIAFVGALRKPKKELE